MTNKEITNIFDYATKELSQDAFLMWLIDNCNCCNENVCRASYRLISKLIDRKLEIGDIEKVEKRRQWGKMDICFFIYLKNKKNIFLAIEDKTFSNTSDYQLKKYSDFIRKNVDENEFIIKKVFYKSSPEDENDIKACENNEYKYLFINQIHGLFNCKDTGITGVEYLDDYVKHIESLYGSFNNYPMDKPMIKWEKINFETYFRKKFIEPYRKNRKFDISYEPWSYQGKYASFAVCKWFEGDLRFALEFRHRKGDAFLSTHIYLNIKPKIGKEGEADPSKREITRNLIDNSPLLDGDNKLIELTKISKKRNKQIARGSKHMKKQLNFSNEISSITNSISKTIDWFLKIANKLDI